MSGATFLSNRSEDEILQDVGAALLSVKIDRRMTLTEMGARLGVSRTMMAQYIAGEAEMGWLRWQKANDEFPELSGRVEETAYERALRAKQRALDLDIPKRERAA
jgi:transcriptional regulator with XRE-family HTH domain